MQVSEFAPRFERAFCSGLATAPVAPVTAWSEGPRRLVQAVWFCYFSFGDPRSMGFFYG